MSTLTREEIAEALKENHDYKAIWKGKIGKDCVNLNNSLAKWLSKRLLHLSIYGNTVPEHLSAKAWELKLRFNAVALYRYHQVKIGSIDPSASEYEDIVKDGESAIHWVAENLENLWT